MHRFLEKGVGLIEPGTGARFTGVVNIGPVFLVLKIEEAGGKEWVIKTPKSRFTFAHQIEEFPLFFFRQPDGGPAYDLDLLNQKLRVLVGNRDLASIVPDFDDLHVAAIDILTTFAKPKRDKGWLNEMGVVTLGGNIIRRLRFMVQGADENISKSAEVAIDRLGEIRNEIDPIVGSMEFYDNPLIVWGGAKINGFFMTNELASVREFVRSTFDLEPWMFEQYGAMGAAMLVIGREESVNDFMRLAPHFMSQNRKSRAREEELLSKGFERGGAELIIHNLGYS